MTDNGFSQTALASATGIPLSVIKKYTAGVRVPNHGNLELLADALKVTPGWLLGSTEFRNQPPVLLKTIEEERKAANTPRLEGITDRYQNYITALSLLGYDVSPIVDSMNSDTYSAEHQTATQLLDNIDTYMYMFCRTYLKPSTQDQETK